MNAGDLILNTLTGLGALSVLCAVAFLLALAGYSIAHAVERRIAARQLVRETEGALKKAADR